MLQMRTSGDKDYDAAKFTVTHKSSLVFTVTTCSHACMALSEVLGLTDINTYEFSIGANTDVPPDVVEIRRDGRLVAETRVSGIVDCEKRKVLWVSWEGGLVQLGTGTVVGALRLLAWKDPQPLAISTAAFAGDAGQVAVWQFEELQGNVTVDIVLSLNCSLLKMMLIDHRRLM